MFRKLLLLCLLSMGCIGTVQAESSVFQNVVTARGGCINIHTIDIQSDTGLIRRDFSFGETSATLYGKPILKWSDEDVNDAVRIFKQCWAKQVSVTPSLQSFAARQIATFEETLSRVITGARAIEARKAAQQAAQDQLKKAEAKNQQERAEEEAQRKQAQLVEQARRDREAAEQARAQAEREGPRIAEAAKQAEEARRARLAAEQKLAEIRGQIDSEMQARNEAPAQVQAAEVARQREIERRADMKDEEKLARPCRVRLQQFNEVQLGMHVRQVERLFGCKGTQVSAAQYGSAKIETFSWEGSAARSTATISFEDLFLKSKMQFGLE